jgi:hypothetical protein
MLSTIELNNVFDKIFVLSSPNIRHTIKSFKDVTKGNGYSDNILELKRKLHYDYIQDNVFPIQGVPKVSTYWPTSGVDIVTRMQLGRNLENVWIMFDHIKGVQGWITMGYHVYDMSYCRVLIIAICDMQFEDANSQILMWFSLTRLVKKEGKIENVNWVN